MQRKVLRTCGRQGRGRCRGREVFAAATHSALYGWDCAPTANKWSVAVAPQRAFVGGPIHFHFHVIRFYISLLLFSCFCFSFFLFCLCYAHFFLCRLINCLASVSVSRDAAAAVAAVAACWMLHGKLPASWASQRQSMQQAHTHCHTHTHTPTQKLASVTIINYCQFTITCMCECLACVCMCVWVCLCAVACSCPCHVLMLPLSCLFPALGPIFNYVFSVCGRFTSQAVQVAGEGSAS